MPLLGGGMEIYMKVRLFNEIYSYGDKFAAISSEVSIKYWELAKICDEVEKLMIGKNMVFHICSNSIGAFVGYVAFINSSQVPLMLNNDVEQEVFDNLMNTYEPQYLFLPKENYSRYGEFTRLMEIFDYVLLKTNYNKYNTLNNELALLLSTSGSTGSPKFVRQSYKNIRTNAESIVKYLELDDSERPITALPMNYTYGLSIINSHLIVGATILLTNKGILQKEFWDFFKKERATSFGGVPYMYQMLKRIGFTKMNLPSLRTITQAGGGLSIELHRYFAEYAQKSNIKFFVMYGQTEATARMTYLPYKKVGKKCGSIGIAIPGGKAILVDESGNEIKDVNAIGELVYSGANVTLGYAESIHDLSRGDERNGILFTGDIARMDEDGYYYIVGRKKRILKMFGIRVNLDDVERMIKCEFYNIDCCCCGKDDELCIFVINDNIVIQNKVRDFVAKRTKINDAMIYVKYINSIPRSDSGKVLYGMLDKLH